MGDQYIKDTVAVGLIVDDYLSLDVYSPERRKAIQGVKTEGGKWVATYARGGSARKQSARTFYVVLDAVLGQISSYGAAPMNKKKADTVRANIAKTQALMLQGK